jgi:hypothetical protein
MSETLSLSSSPSVGVVPTTGSDDDEMKGA